jgi:hypothetical protein
MSCRETGRSAAGTPKYAVALNCARASAADD